MLWLLVCMCALVVVVAITFDSAFGWCWECTSVVEFIDSCPAAMTVVVVVHTSCATNTTPIFLSHTFSSCSVSHLLVGTFGVVVVANRTVVVVVCACPSPPSGCSDFCLHSLELAVVVITVIESGRHAWQGE